MEPWREELYLAHHGILGQRWGRKNGPPYPLDASDHSASERKAGWRKSLSKDEKRENKKNKYIAKQRKINESERQYTNKKYAKAHNKFEKRENKANTKYEETGKERYKKKADRISADRIKLESTNKLRNIAYDNLDKYIKNMSQEQMKGEKSYAMKKSVGQVFARAALAGSTGVMVYGGKGYQDFKNDYRVSQIAKASQNNQAPIQTQKKKKR